MIALLIGLTLLAPPREGVTFQCPPRPAMDSGCEKSPGWLTELADAAVPLMGAARGLPPGFYCRRAERALTLALAHDPSTLTAEERILTQNLAVRVAISKGCADADTGGRVHANHGAAPRALAVRVVRRHALSAAKLRVLGSKPMPDLDRFVGPRAKWRELKSRSIPLEHDQMEAFTRAFRPIRSGDTRAIFSQLLALDTSWTPHVTPLVGRVELRSGLAEDAPACVAKLVPARLRCEVGRLEAVHAPTPDAKHVRSIFMNFVLDRVRCNECHGPNSPRADANDPLFGDLDLLPSEDEAHLSTRARRVRKLGTPGDETQP